MNDNLRKLLGLENVVAAGGVENTEIGAEDVIVLGIPREAVERGHIERYLREFERVGKRKFMRRILVSFDGYDYDPREVYEVPEIRKWMARLLTNVPHLFYFMSAENGNLRTVYSCVAPIVSSAAGSVDIDVARAKVQIEKLLRSAVSFARKNGASAAEQFSLAETIVGELGYDQFA